MLATNKIYDTICFEDGTYAVVERLNPQNPRSMEVIAIFFDPQRAQNYAALENQIDQFTIIDADKPDDESIHSKPEPEPKPEPIKERNKIEELSEHQKVVLLALKSKMDENRLVIGQSQTAISKLTGHILSPGSIHQAIRMIERAGYLKIHKNLRGYVRACSTYEILQPALEIT